jgi:hypothetical protein
MFFSCSHIRSPALIFDVRVETIKASNVLSHPKGGFQASHDAEVVRHLWRGNES